MNLALFDFDGTITKNDSFFGFIKFTVGDIRFIIGLFRLLPIFILYKLKLMPNYKVKERVIKYFFQGLNEKEFKSSATNYSLHHIDAILRFKAMEKVKWHKKKGDKVVIVSASMQCYLKPWCDKNGIELISTKLEFINGKITGKLLTKNCYGMEKVDKIKINYDLNKYTYIYAYGDSRGDKEMLELAHEKYMKWVRI